MLFVHELIHLILSLATGLLVYFLYQKWQAVLWAVLVGILMDLDHIVDYLAFKGSFSINFSEFFSGEYFLEAGKLFTPLHSYEIAILIAIISLIVLKFKNTQKVIVSVLLAVAFSMTLHMVLDTLTYGPRWTTYFMTDRIINDFELEKFDFNNS